MGTRSCGPLRSRGSSIFPLRSAFPRSCLTFFWRSPVLSRSCFAFLCSCIKECMCGGWGYDSSHARCVCMDGSGGPGQLATAPLPPLVTRARCTSILAFPRSSINLRSRVPKIPGKRKRETRNARPSLLFCFYPVCWVNSFFCVQPPSARDPDLPRTHSLL